MPESKDCGGNTNLLTTPQGTQLIHVFHCDLSPFSFLLFDFSYADRGSQRSMKEERMEEIRGIWGVKSKVTSGSFIRR